MLFSIERLIVVFFPFKRYEYFSHRRNKCIISGLLILSLVLYSFSLVTSGLESDHDKSIYSCVTKKDWFELVKLMAFIDTIFTMIIPFLIISISNLMIVYKLIAMSKCFGCGANKNQITSNLIKNENSLLKSQFYLKKPGLKSELNSGLDSSFYLRSSIFKNSRTISIDLISHQKKNSTISTNDIKKSVITNSILLNMNVMGSRSALMKANTISSMLRQSTEMKRARTYSKTTRMLLIVSTTFLILNFPIAFSKIRYYFNDYNHLLIDLVENETSNSSASLKNELETNLNEQIIERITCYIYYLNFSLNFFFIH